LSPAQKCYKLYCFFVLNSEMLEKNIRCACHPPHYWIKVGVWPSEYWRSFIVIKHYSSDMWIKII